MSTVGTKEIIASVPAQFSTTSVGKKVLMAITGLCVSAFVVVHLLGNLQLFIGQDQLNHYAETLQSMTVLKWIFRLAMFTFIAIHIWKGVVLWLENRRSRPINYFNEDTVQATIASRTMIYTGAFILFFVVYHLMHFTLIVTNPEYAGLKDAAGRFDAYSMVIHGFQNYLISAVYIIAMALMSFHLSHALSSMFQTLGLNNSRHIDKLKLFSTLIAWVFFLAYSSMPVAVMLKLVQLPGGGH